MAKKKKIACTNPRLGPLLQDAPSDRLAEPGRELDRQLFQAHMDECALCRESMLDHAADTAIEQVAAARGVTTRDVMNDLVRASQEIQEAARQEGVPFAEMLKRITAKSQRMVRATH